MSLRAPVALYLVLAAFPALAADIIVDGERMTPRQVVDHQEKNMVAFAFLAPEKWHDTSQVIWNYANVNLPVSFTITAENPAKAEAYFFFQPVHYFAFRPDSGFWKEGYVAAGGSMKLRPQPPAATLGAFVRKARGGAPNLKFVGSKDLPDLPSALQVHFAKDQRGVAVKVTYDFNGQPVEEEFYAVCYQQVLPYDGPRGHVDEIDWGLTYLHSFRALQGTLDKRRNVFAAIAHSLKPNPAYLQRVGAIEKVLGEQWQRNLKAGYDQIRAAGELSKQLSRNSDAFLANVDNQLKASRAADAKSTAQGRSANDTFDDYIRGVVTTDDPYWGTSQHSLNQEYHWTDGYGSYRHSNDSSYDPNKNENGSWQLMPTSK